MLRSIPAPVIPSCTLDVPECVRVTRVANRFLVFAATAILLALPTVVAGQTGVTITSLTADPTLPVQYGTAVT